jgi:hypothetical protein
MKIFSLFTAVALLAVAIIPINSAQAALNTLNGLNASAQTIVNDTNVTVTSSGTTHSIGWSGVLQGSRGGTGTNTIMTQGSILFADSSGVYSQDNSNLFWDDTNKVLKVANVTGSDSTGFIVKSGNGQSVSLMGSDGSDANGGSILIGSGQGASGYQGGSINIFAAEGGNNNTSGHINILGGHGAGEFNGGLGNGGNVTVAAGVSEKGFPGNVVVQGGNTSSSSENEAGNASLLGGTGATNAPGGRVVVQGGGGRSGGEVVIAGGVSTNISGSGGSISLMLGTRGGTGGAHGSLTVFPGGWSSSGARGTLDFNSLTAQRLYTYPDATGTLVLLQSSQTFTGLNRFEASSNSTIYIGSASKSGCIALGDSDGSGITYVTANDGVLSASSTKPGICQ